MRRVIALIGIVSLVICFASSASALDTTLFTDSSQGISGLIDIEDTGDYIVMVQTRLRELGYFHFKATGRFQGMTRSASIEFQRFQTTVDGQQIISDGTIGQQSIDILFSTRAVRSPIAQSIPIGPSFSQSQTKRGELVDWSEVKTLLSADTAYTLTDYNTGATFQVVFTGGENHAEVECRSASDTADYKELYGGEFTFFKRPMLISVGERLIACSLQGEPHGEDTVSNNDMAGHACLYFNGSRSHVAGIMDVEHNANVYRATGQGQ